MISLTCRLAMAAILVCPVWTISLHAQDPALASSATLSTSDTSPAHSQAPTPSTTFNASPGIDAVGKLFLYFAIIAGIGGSLVYITRHGLPFRHTTATKDRKLQLLETRPLGNKQFLVVVAYEDSRMLLGITPGKIDYLCPLDTSSQSEQSFDSLMAIRTNPPASR